jgi:hypothetical protein
MKKAILGSLRIAAKVTFVGTVPFSCADALSSDRSSLQKDVPPLAAV